MFALFDQEELGLIGSRVFVDAYLTAADQKDGDKFQVLASWILDSVLDYNDLPGTQSFPAGIQYALPSLYNSVVKNNYRGDFLLMTSQTADRVNMNVTSKYMKENGMNLFFGNSFYYSNCRERERDGVEEGGGENIP